ncbi:MAG: sulfotransferase [Rhizomicrobium sp.]
MKGPDFICIGLPKAGTGWLYDQLDAHPDFWMPPVKEILYLERPISKMQFVRPSGQPRRGRGDRERLVNRPNLDARDYEFLKFAATCQGEPRDMTRYAQLFCYKGDLLSGDISPPYWSLSEDVIETIGARFPETKIIMLVRDPVSRAWSRISMAYRSELFDPLLLHDRAGFKGYVDATRKIGSIRATEIMQRWQRLAPRNPFQWFAFDDIAERPDKARHDIVTFLGADPDKKGSGLVADYNRKSEEKKLDMNVMTRAVLAEHYAEELKAGAQQFGGAAIGWLSKYSA